MRSCRTDRACCNESDSVNLIQQLRTGHSPGNLTQYIGSLPNHKGGRKKKTTCRLQLSVVVVVGNRGKGKTKTRNNKAR